MGACSPRKILKFRPCESASEAVGDHYNICGNWSVNSGAGADPEIEEGGPYI